MRLPKEIRQVANRLRKFSRHKNGVLKWYFFEGFEMKFAKNKRLKENARKGQS
ncbi:hypothetical protein ABIC89_001049 [Variovorax boronicumulans]